MLMYNHCQITISYMYIHALAIHEYLQASNYISRVHLHIIVCDPLDKEEEGLDGGKPAVN